MAGEWAVTTDHLVLGPELSVGIGEITWRFSTAGGPGGQHANTSNTRVEATLDILRSTSLPPWARDRLVERLGETVTVASSERRSQAQNRELALRRLAQRLHRGLQVDAPRRATRPTEMSQRRRLEAKRRRAQLKRQRRDSGGQAEPD